MLKVWNMVLVALAFLLSIFGTFLTRSGVVNSVHSFSQSPLGGWFLGFIVVCTVFTVGLIYFRLPLLRARTKLESLVSREATFLFPRGLDGKRIHTSAIYRFMSKGARGVVLESLRAPRKCTSLDSHAAKAG